MKTASFRTTRNGGIYAFFSATSVGAMIAASPMLSQPASAQNAVTSVTPAPAAATDPSSQLGEVVVTSRKRAERLQDVPLAITALTASDLRKDGIQDLRDIALQTPGLTFTSAGANYNSKPIIRGQTDLGGQNNVPVFFDGIFVSNTSAIDFGLIDLERVEVVKGPVSATYGRSAYAGAINYVSAKPTNDYRGYAELTGGDYGKFNARGSISGPIIDDVLKGGVSASYDRFDGTYHDSTTHQDAGGYDKKDVLVNLDWTPSEHIEVRPVVYYGKDTFDDPASTFAKPNCGIGFYTSFCGNVSNGNFVGPYISPPGDYGQTGNTRTVFTSNLQVNFKYDWGSISSLTGFDSFLTSEYNEFDQQEFGTATPTYYLPAGAAVGGFGPAGVATGSTALTPLHFGYVNKNHDFSQELRYASPQNQPFRWTVGGYYAKSYAYSDLSLARGTCAVPAGQYISDPFAVPCGVTKSLQHTLGYGGSRIYAAFAGADYDIIHNLTLSSEVRYTEDQESEFNAYSIYTPFPVSGYSTATGSTYNPTGLGKEQAKFYSVTTRTSLKYKFAPNSTVYVSAANGEKSGGFNININYPTYQPEKNWTYEAGVKSTFLDHRLQVDADVFYIDASKYQITGPPPGSTLPGGFITTNYGGLATTGLEASAAYIINEWARASVGIGYTDPKFKSDGADFSTEDITICRSVAGCAPRIGTDKVGNPLVHLKGLRPPGESNVTFNTALDLNYPLWDDYKLVGRIDYRYESKQYYQFPIDTGSYGPRNVVNLRAGVEKGPYSVSLWVRNLTDDKTPISVADTYATGASGFQGASFYPVAVLPDGRSFGATLRYAFGGK